MDSSPLKTFLLYIGLVFICIFTVECALEFRHYLKGYDTLIFGVKQKREAAAPSQSAQIERPKQVYGPTQDFPFRSLILDQNDQESMRLWIASASHAEGGRVAASKVFPNQICPLASSIKNCETINGSKAGMTVSENISLMQEYAPIYNPKYALLYQMSNIISSQERKITHPEPSGQENTTNSVFEMLVDLKELSKTLQKSSLYVHLSDYIGGNIKLQGPLKAELPDEFAIEFDEQIMQFISESRQLGLIPLLATFASSHDHSNIEQMPFSLRTNFVKYNTYLSPSGWITMVSRYNQRLRNIAKKESVPLIDLDKLFTGKHSNFIDFVHFNEKGHTLVAQIIGQELSRLINTGSTVK